MAEPKKRAVLNFGAGEKSPVSKDQFHRGDFELFQLEGRGHRSGMDAMLLGASLPENASGIVADLGAGVGAAGLAAINIHRELRAKLVEIDVELADLGKKALKLDGNRHLTHRAEFITADVTLSGAERARANLIENSVDYVIANPPYNPLEMRPSPDVGRAKAHVISEGGLDSWMRTAAAILKPDGLFCLIYRTERLGEIIAGAQGRFGDMRILPVHSKAGEIAKRVVIRCRKGSRAPLTIAPGIVMHTPDGGQTEEAACVLNGRALLDFGD